MLKGIPIIVRAIPVGDETDAIGRTAAMPLHETITAGLVTLDIGGHKVDLTCAESDGSFILFVHVDARECKAYPGADPDEHAFVFAKEQADG